jgi:hypothetical protein
MNKMLATCPGTMNPPNLAEAVDSAILALSELDGPSVELHSAFAGTLRWSGVPEVYAPPYFWAPRSRAGVAERLEEARANAARCANERLAWHQPWWRAELMRDHEEYRRRVDAWRRQEELMKPVRPNRHVCLTLHAAYAHDIAGLSTRWAIGYSVGLKGTPDSRNDEVLPRFKTAGKIVEAGRQAAHTLGAWPWAEYPDGAIPNSWWRDESTLEALKCASASFGLTPGRCPYPPHAQNVCVALLPL